MNRIIKFRCWIRDWAGGRMAHDGFAVNEFGKVFFKEDDSETYIKGYPGKQERTLMQFTGLSDKNGTPIYEGDIVKYYDSYLDDDVEEGIGRIAQNNEAHAVGGFGLFDKNGRTHRMIGGVNSIFWLEVIGNVYENPNLLTPKENE